MRYLLLIVLISGCTPCKAYHTKTEYQIQCNAEGCVMQYTQETVQTEGVQPKE